MHASNVNEIKQNINPRRDPSVLIVMSKEKKEKKGWFQRRQEKQMKKAGRMMGSFLKGVKEALKEDTENKT